MLAVVLGYWLDVTAFAIVAVGLTTGVHLWLRRGDRGRVSVKGWLSVAAVVAMAWAAVVFADAHERAGLKARLEGLAPTYAAEIELLGHAKVGFGTAPNDPTYLRIIEAEKRWERLNPNVADIYTFRRRPDGKIAFVVDSETDYDRDGKYDADREQRTPIGETYEDTTGSFDAALNGTSAFADEPETDRWGTWVTACVPLYDANGHVEAALGVDYDANRWYGDLLFVRAGALGVAGVLLAAVVGGMAVLSLARSESAKRLALQRQLVIASQEAALHDGLTGLPNRLLFGERIDASLERSKVDPSFRFAVLFVDCDNFKGVNDTLGHHAGDSLLRQIGQRLTAVACGPEDVAARIGGDEFAVLLCGLASSAEADDVAGRLMAASAQPYTIGEQFVRSGMSIGVTDSAIGYRTTEQMMRDADVAMYRAKRGGRNRIVRHAPDAATPPEPLAA